MYSGTRHEAHLRAEHKVAIRICNAPKFLAEGGKHWSRRALEGRLFGVGPVAIAQDSVNKSGRLGPEGRAARAICEGAYKVRVRLRACGLAIHAVRPLPAGPAHGWPGWPRGMTASASSRSSADREGSRRADRAAVWAEPRKACLLHLAVLELLELLYR